MKKYIIYICACAMALSATAQSLTGSYFMQGMMQRTDLNPALEPELGYVTLPGLGGLGLNLRGTMGLGQLFMENPKDPTGDFVTFMHPDISIDDVDYKDNNRLLQDLRVPVLGVGFRGLGGYNTIGVALRETAGINMPGDMFPLLKESLSNRSYNINNVGVHAMVWGEVGIGHSHQVTDHLRIGAKLKLLLGGARLDAKLKNVTLDLQDPNRWIAKADAQLDVSLQGFEWGEPKTVDRSQPHEAGQSSRYECVDFDNIDVKNPGLNGFGLGADLGAEYDLGYVVNGLKVSAAITDLGFINWKHTARATNASHEFEFRGFDHVRIDKDGNEVPIDDQTQQLIDDLSELYALQDMGTAKVHSTLGSTVNVGVQYTLPCYKRLSFGLLSTTRINGKYSWNEERVSVNFCPGKVLELNVSAGAGSFGASFGWLLNFKPKGFNLFVGMDHMLGRVAKPFVPLKTNGDLYMGLNFTFGKRKPNYK